MSKLALDFAVFAMLSGAVWAQGPGGRGGMMRTPAFTALDTDGDGSISAAEAAKAPVALKALDRNSDGSLSEEEVRPAFGRAGREGGGREGGGREGGGRGGRGGRGGEPGETAGPTADEMVQTLMAFDRNADGKLSRDEVPERMQGLFDRADADRNGELAADEIRKTAQAQSAPGGRGGREGGGREGGRGEGGRGERPNFMRPNFMGMDPILAALDSDTDGAISAAELAGAPASLRKLDKDNDGRLSEDEVRMNPGLGGRGRQ